MRIAIIGGTRFIGVATIEDLLAHGHDVAVIHRGRNESPDAPPTTHVHLDRRDVPALRTALVDVRADALIDTCAYTRADAETAIVAIEGRPAVVLSSQDVYRAFRAVREERPATDAVPLDEDSPVREGDDRYLYRGLPAMNDQADPDEYENLDVEDAYLAAGATVLRLPQVYGERDPQRREEHILRRVRAGRRRIPVGAGTWLWTRGYVRDVAAAIRLAIETGAGAGTALNVGERRTLTARQLAERILDHAGSDAELVQVPDDVVPEDLFVTRAIAQHLVTSSARARATLGWQDGEADAALRTTVAWHLAHAPEDDGDFAADDAALAAAAG